VNTSTKTILSQFKFKQKKDNNTLTRIKSYSGIYLMMLPGLLFFLIFSYIPMPGIIVAFQNYTPWQGILKSEWVGILHFKNFFSSIYFPEITRNTLLLSVFKIATLQISAVIFALLLNEVPNKIFKKSVQSVSILPHFVSWIVISAILYVFMGNDYGVLNKMFVTFGIKPIEWYLRADLWRGIIVTSTVWKEIGYSSIIYLATITGIGQELYEAAQIDGASRLKQILYITIPNLRPTVALLIILATGHIMQGDFGQIFALVGNNTVLYPTVDVIDTFVYRGAFQQGNFSFSAAAGLFQSVIGLIAVYMSNKIANKLGNQGLW
jgi:putative aldouronate transport system permease protein